QLLQARATPHSTATPEIATATTTALSPRRPAARPTAAARPQNENAPPDSLPMGRCAWKCRRQECLNCVADYCRRLKTRVPLVPPKPKLFFTATSIRMSRAVLAQ